MRVMLDTNILVSAFIFKSKKINELIEELSNKHKIVIASYCINELQDLIDYKFNVSIKALNDFLLTFPFELVYSPNDVEEKLFKIRDEEDYIILHTAILEDVDIFITGDKDFKDVKIERPEILTVNEFLEKYKKSH
jgi:putative PIN family toxin of toxin-antitoxin system